MANLVIHIPRSTTELFADILPLARLAPIFSVEGVGESSAFVAVFPDLPRSIDLAIRLVDEASKVQGPWINVNGRRVMRPTRFWTALLCYRESLAEAGTRDYCADQARRVADVGGCLDRPCLSRCQFMCTRCLAVNSERGATSVLAQLQAIAIQAEVDWCPNLTLNKEI
jgi:hypothetical protein